MKTLPFILVCNLLLATSCSIPMTLGEAQIAYSAVEVGQTEQEVIARLGQPMKRNKNGHTYWRESNGPDNYVELQVDFNPSGIVSKVTRSAHSYSRGLENTREPFEDTKK